MAEETAEQTTLADDLFGDDSVVEPQQAAPAATASADAPSPKPEATLDNGDGNDDDDDDDDDAGGLFGDDSDLDDEAQPPTTNRAAYEDDVSPEEAEKRRNLEYEEDEDEQMETIAKHEAVAQIELANIGTPTTDKVWHARLPNFLSLQSKPFDELMWDPEEAVESANNNSQQGLDEEQGAATNKANLPDENYIRWRWAKDDQGNPIKQSNSRIVRWSDGSLSLQVGAELFDVSIAVDNSNVPTGAPNVQASKPASNAGPSHIDPTSRHSLTYLVTEHDYAGLLEAQASVYGTMKFRPTTLQSKVHRALAGNVQNKYLKTVRTKFADMPSEDPEKKKAEQEKAELDKAKRLKKKEQHNRRQKPARRQTRFEDNEGSAGEEYGDEDDEDGYGDGGVSGYGNSRSQPKRGAGGPLAQDDYDDDDGFVVDDSPDDGDSDSGDRRRKKSRKRAEPEYSDDEPDEMDQAEKRIEEEERKRKERRKEEKDRAAAAPPAPAAPAPRRRLVIEESDEE
ncbi:Leo1-domain-containing protein [Meredithblackwellia eburnea MCA 4105]